MIGSRDCLVSISRPDWWLVPWFWFCSAPIENSKWSLIWYLQYLYLIHFSWRFVYFNLSQCIWLDKKNSLLRFRFRGVKVFFRNAVLIRRYAMILIGRTQWMMRTFQFDLNEVMKCKGGKICAAYSLFELNERAEFTLEIIYASCATFLFLPHFDVICDLLLNRRTATWNLFVKYTTLNHSLC